MNREEQGQKHTTYDKVAVLRVDVVDLHVTRLRKLVRPRDVHGLAPGRDGVRDRLGNGRARLVRRGRAASDADALDVNADVRVQRGGLRDCLLSAELDGDRVRRAAAAVERVSITTTTGKKSLRAPMGLHT